jgi:type IV secretion system protein VirD4
VLVSGLPPIRAKKLRYYEDGNFSVRVLSSPKLATGRYQDCPALRPDDWTGQVRTMDPRLAAVLAREMGEAGAEDEGGLQRHPGLPEAEAVRPMEAAVDDLAQVLDDESDSIAQGRAPGLDPLRRAAALQRAHAMNQDPGRRDDDLLPSF